MKIPLLNSIRFRILLLFLLAGGLINLLLFAGGLIFTRASQIDALRHEMDLMIRVAALGLSGEEAASWLRRSPPNDGKERQALLLDPGYLPVQKKLEAIRTGGLGRDSYVYLFRQGSGDRTIQYMAYSLPFRDAQKTNLPFQEEDGSPFTVMLEALQNKSVRTEPELTWDPAEQVHSLSAYAPVYDPQGDYLAMLGVDFTDKGFSDRLWTASLWIAGAGLAMLTVLMASSFFIAGHLRRSFSTVNDLVEDLAQGEGNLNQRIEILTKDEFGVLARHLNHFIGTIHNIILNVQTIGISQEDLAQQVEKTLDQHGAQSHEALTRVQGMVDRYELLSESVRSAVNAVQTIGESLAVLEERIEAERRCLSSSATAMEKQVDSLENISRIAEEKKALSQNLKTLTEGGFKTVRQTFQHLEAAAKDLNTIQGTIDLIQSISENTNLLAMNAAVEAAHAGEKGLGFAVIAGEIRRLSSSTKQNATAISQSLEALIHNLNLAQKTGKDSSTALQTISQGVDTLVQSFLSILDLLSLASKGNETIKQSIVELKDLGNQVHEASQVINQNADTGQRGMEIIAAVNIEIQSELIGIKEKIHHLNSAAQDMRELGEDNAGRLGEMLGEISRFKT